MPDFKIILLLLTLSYLPGFVTGQESAQPKQAWINKISEYRDYLLLKNVDAVKELHGLLKKWDMLGSRKGESETLMLNALKYSMIDKDSFNVIRKMALRYMRGSALAQDFTREDLAIMEKNAALLNLIFLGALTSEFPFKINPHTELFQELISYDLAPGDKVGEIGAGDGAFALLLNRVEPGVTLHVNELDGAFLQYIQIQLDENPDMFDVNQVHLVKGNKRSTGLEGQELDKIIRLRVVGLQKNGVFTKIESVLVGTDGNNGQLIADDGRGIADVFSPGIVNHDPDRFARPRCTRNPCGCCLRFLLHRGN